MPYVTNEKSYASTGVGTTALVLSSVATAAVAGLFGGNGVGGLFGNNNPAASAAYQLSQKDTEIAELKAERYTDHQTAAVNFEISNLKQRLAAIEAAAPLREKVVGEQIGFGEPEESDIPEGAPSAGPVTAKLRDFTVTILGAEAVEDEDGAPAIRFWYEFTNNSEDLASVFSELLVEAGQDGMKLGMAYLPDDVPENMYGLLKVAPGYTIRCAELYSYDPEGGTVAFRLRDWDEDGAAIYYADPANLPGPPQDSFEIVPDGSVPDFMRDIPDTDGSAYVTDDIEVVEDWEGNDMLRIYISFTNNTDEETSFFSEYSVYAMQDGYELRSAYPKDETEEDANYIVDIKPGETILCAFNYAIRSDSPICIVIENFWGNSGYFGDILVSN